jgi:hypothetical protein
LLLADSKLSDLIFISLVFDVCLFCDLRHKHLLNDRDRKKEEGGGHGGMRGFLDVLMQELVQFYCGIFFLGILVLD